MRLGRRWRHSVRHGRALNRARRLYELLPPLDGVEAVAIYRMLIAITDAWDFTLAGEIVVAAPRAPHKAAGPRSDAAP